MRRHARTTPGSETMVLTASAGAPSTCCQQEIPAKAHLNATVFSYQYRERSQQLLSEEGQRQSSAQFTDVSYIPTTLQSYLREVELPVKLR